MAVVGLRVTWMGHSTVLLELDGVRLLTDPLLRRRVMHLRRVAPPATSPERVDAVLVSHSHYDHLDVNSLTRLEHSTRIVAPVGTARRLRGWSDDLVEVDVGDEVRVDSVTV